VLTVHLLLLIGHILFASITVGATISYAFWLALAELEPRHLAFTIRAIRHSDRLVAIPAFFLTFATGAWLVYEGGVPLDRFWLVVSVVVYVAVLVVGFVVFGPVVRRELAALERGGTRDPDYLRLRRQAQLLSLGTIAALSMILALMVAKPG
jgi:uncharacterized membrane protein